MEKSHLDPRRLLPPLAFGAVAIGYIAVARGFTNETSAEAPLLYGEVMAALSAMVFLLGLRPVRSAPEPQELGSVRRPGALHWQRVLLINALAAVTVVLVLLLGFYVGIPLFLFFFFWRIAKFSALRSAAVGLVFVGLMWLSFGYLLNLEIYAGYVVPLFLPN